LGGALPGGEGGGPCARDFSEWDQAGGEKEKKCETGFGKFFSVHAGSWGKEGRDGYGWGTGFLPSEGSCRVQTTPVGPKTDLWPGPLRGHVMGRGRWWPGGKTQSFTKPGDPRDGHRDPFVPASGGRGAGNGGFRGKSGGGGTSGWGRNLRG